MLDALDYKILGYLSWNGRAKWSELAQVLELSAPSTAERVKRLEEKGVITGYCANLNYRHLGYLITAFIAVTLSHPKYIRPLAYLAFIGKISHFCADWQKNFESI